jgi:pre-mRNA-splicing factor SPF27
MGQPTNSGETSAATVKIDALPYTDPFPEDYENYALSLIEHEMANGGVAFNEIKALSHLPPFDASLGPAQLGPRMRQEYDALVARGAQPRPSSERIGLQLAQERQLFAPSDATDEDGWKGSLNKAKVELESQRSRQLNLELQQLYEGGQWHLHVAQLQQQGEYAKEKLERQKRKVDEINAERKSMQENSADVKEMQRKTAKYHKLTHGNIRLLHATENLKNEVQQLQQGVSDMDTA